jgi:hypothetical protein
MSCPAGRRQKFQEGRDLARRVANPRVFRLMKAAATGDYQPVGDAWRADCVVALSFGYSLSGDGAAAPGAVNERLAAFIGRHAGDKPVIAQYEVAAALSARSEPDMIRAVIGGPPTTRETYLNTREVLLEASATMQRSRLGIALLVAHANHLPRVVAAAGAVGMEFVVPPCLPSLWDTGSEQPWIRSRGRWVTREMPTIALFAARGWLST